MDEAVGDCELARKSAEAAGDRNAEAMMSTDLAAALLSTGRSGASQERCFAPPSRSSRKSGNLDGVGAAMSNLGAALLVTGDLNEARKPPARLRSQLSGGRRQRGVKRSVSTILETCPARTGICRSRRQPTSKPWPQPSRPAINPRSPMSSAA